MFTHNIYACSIRCKDKQTIWQDCEDDGDFEQEECCVGGVPLVWKGSARIRSFETYQQLLEICWWRTSYVHSSHLRVWERRKWKKAGMNCVKGQRQKIALWQILLPYRYDANNYYINQLTTDLSGFHSQGREQKLGRQLGEHGKHLKLGRCFSLTFNLGRSTFSLTILNENPVNSFTVEWVLRQKNLIFCII